MQSRFKERGSQIPKTKQYGVGRGFGTMVGRKLRLEIACCATASSWLQRLNWFLTHQAQRIIRIEERSDN